MGLRDTNYYVYDINKQVAGLYCTLQGNVAIIL